MRLTTDNSPLNTMSDEMAHELTRILDWWQRRMTDHQYGGFYGRIDGEGRLVENADKGVILNARILWTFSTAMLHQPQPVYREMADRAYRYFIDRFIDRDDGGVYWMLDYKGNAVETRKQIYAQAFALYALAAYYELTRDAKALDTAILIFHLVERHSYDPEYGGYTEAFDRRWGALADHRLSDKDMQAAKTMNTHLHLLEAYTALYTVSHDATVYTALHRLTTCYLEKFVDPHRGHLHLFFDREWKLLSDIDSYGHDIESSWLLTEAGHLLNDDVLTIRIRNVAVQLAKTVLAEGVAPDGSLYHERKDGHLDADRHWWPQAEAVMGFGNAFRLTGDDRFAQASLDAWHFIQKHFIRHTPDGRYDEWHWRLNSDLAPVLSEDLAGPWKCPYHTGRMCIMIPG